MKDSIKVIVQTLKDHRDRRVMAVFTLIFFAFLLTMPVFIVPGDTISFQLSLFTVRDYLLMSVLSLLTGLIFALQWRSIREIRSRKATSAAGGFFSSLPALAGAAMSTVYCGCGVAVILGFLGFGASSIFFFINHQSYFLGGGIVLMLISLYFATRRVGKTCKVS